MPILSFLLFAIVASFTPGPNNIMAMALANQIGFKKALPFCFGVGTGFFIILVLCSYFNLLLQSLVPKIESFLCVFGSLYLLFLAFKILTSKPNHETLNEEKTKNHFFIAILLQFINPKGILNSLTAVSTFLLPYHTAHSFLLSFSLFFACIGFLGTLSWSLFGSVFKTFLSKYRMPFNIIMSLLLIYCAFSILKEVFSPQLFL
jgi:threonine/homoserine/homoserine lactone efflux protein